MKWANKETFTNDLFWFQSQRKRLLESLNVGVLNVTLVFA